MQFFFSFSWMRRLTGGLAIVSLVLVLTTSLAACGGSSTNSGTTASGPVNLTYWSWIPGIDKIVAAWNSSHPNIHVTVQNVGSGQVEYDKLFTAIKANNEPDMGMIEFQLLPDFESTGALVDLSQYGANAVKDQFLPWTWSQVTQGNAVLAIPGDTGPMVLYYRQDIFQKYNIPVPTTWAQYADDAAKLHAAAPNEYITDFPAKDPGWFTGLVWQAGGQLFNINGQSWKVSINTPQAQQVASYWQDLISKKLVKTEPDFTNAWYNDLQTGAVATWISASWGYGIIEPNAAQTSGKWRVAPIPQWQAGQSANGNWGGSSIAVFKTSKHPKEATQFATWLYSNSQSLNLLFAGGGTPADSAFQDAPVLNAPSSFFGNQVLNTVFKQASTQVNTNFQWGPTMNQVYNDMGDNFANALNGHGTLTDALNAAQQSTITFMQKQGFTVST
jgi:multiple sugar transport system substrate-binding protein